MRSGAGHCLAYTRDNDERSTASGASLTATIAAATRRSCTGVKSVELRSRDVAAFFTRESEMRCAFNESFARAAHDSLQMI